MRCERAKRARACEVTAATTSDDGAYVTAHTHDSHQRAHLLERRNLPQEHAPAVADARVHDGDAVVERGDVNADRLDRVLGCSDARLALGERCFCAREAREAES